MKTRPSLLILVAATFLGGNAWADPIPDPIRDYLSLQVPERSEFIGTLEFIQRVKVDVDGDGADEIFIGTWYRHSGSNQAYYWSAYKEVKGGYQRITSPNQDVHIASFENVYIGLIQEISKQGIVAAYDVETDTPENAEVIKVGELHFYHLTDDRLVDQKSGPLDLAHAEQKKTYDRYFGMSVKTRKPTSIDTFTSDQLKQMGYAIPNWEQSDTNVLPEERIEVFQNVAEDMKKVLLAAPDDLTGKKSPWFKTLTECQLALSQAAKTGTRKDLFAIIPPTAKFFTRDREIEDLTKPLGDLRYHLEVSGVPIIKELAKVVSENNGTLDAATAELAVKVFSVRGFANEPDWEGEIGDQMPIKSAGVLIANPEIMPLLEALPVEQLDIFLNADTSNAYFRYYEKDGDEMPILRQRYSENREVLHKCFNKLSAKVAPYRAKLYGEEQE